MMTTIHDINGMVVHRYPMPAIDSNMYIIIEDGEALIIDPNINKDAEALLKSHGVKKVIVLLTHEHFDHISGVNWLRGLFSTKIYCSEETATNIGDAESNHAKYWDVIMMDKPEEIQRLGELVKDKNYSCYADVVLTDEEELIWKTLSVRLVYAPGHSKGSCLVFVDELLFTGDSLVNGAGVVCRLPGGSWRMFEKRTLPILLGVEDNNMIFPGHGKPAPMAELRKYLVKYGSV